MKKVIGFTYDLKTDWQLAPDDPVDLNAEFDPPIVVEHISQALQSAGHIVRHIGNAKRLLEGINKLNVDFVFNICEGYSGRCRESQVPMILEMYGIPYIGSDGLTMALTLDKLMAKRIFLAESIPTPPFFEACCADDLSKEKAVTIGYPLFVKPRFEGTSKGLTHSSRVENFTALRKEVEKITTTYKQPALVEKFIKGTEFTVAIIGNSPPEALPVVQIAIKGKTDLGDDFYTFDRVVNESDTVQYLCPAGIPDKLARIMQEMAMKVYQSVDCRDFGRVDFRVDENNQPFVLEINPLPSLSQEDAFYFIAKALGISYEEIVNRIILSGMERLGIVCEGNSSKIYREAAR